jgi:lysyl-tRNA synthetase class I
MTMKIPKAVWDDAKAVCSSIYHMNAPYAIGYAFIMHANKREVFQGEFVGQRDKNRLNKDEFDGFINFETGEQVNLTEGN